MAITFAKKKEQLLELKNKFLSSEGMLVVNYDGITAQELNDLRFSTKLLFPVTFLVCKNTLLNLFLSKNLDINLDLNKLPTLIVFILEDERFETLLFLKNYLKQIKITPKSRKIFSFLLAYEKRKNKIYSNSILEKTASFGNLSFIYQNLLGTYISVVKKLLLVLKGVTGEIKKKGT